MRVIYEINLTPHKHTKLETFRQAQNTIEISIETREQSENLQPMALMAKYIKPFVYGFVILFASFESDPLKINTFKTKISSYL